MWRLEINAKPFLGITHTIKEGIRVLINYKFTGKKLKLTQKVNNVHLFQFTVCPLFNSLFGGHVFSVETSRTDENVAIRVTIKRA